MFHRYALVLAPLFALQANAQLLTLSDEDGVALENGSTVVHHGMASDELLEVHLVATLLGNETKEVNMRRYEISVQPGTQNYFCWGICYDAQDAGLIPIWNSLNQHSLYLNGGEPVSNFGGYHRPQGVEGTSVYRYVWFDVDNRDDSVWVNLEFHSMPVGIAEVGRATRLSVFPNPSKGSDVQFDIDMPQTSGGTTTLVIHNAVGQRIKTSTIRTGQPVARLSTEGMAPGLYFASVDLQGRILVTQRFVVSGR